MLCLYVRNMKIDKNEREGYSIKSPKTRNCKSIFGLTLHLISAPWNSETMKNKQEVTSQGVIWTMLHKYLDQLVKYGAKIVTLGVFLRTWNNIKKITASHAGNGGQPKNQILPPSVISSRPIALLSFSNPLTLISLHMKISSDSTKCFAFLCPHFITDFSYYLEYSFPCSKIG